MNPRANLLRFLAVLGLLACLIPAIARTQPAADTDSMIYGGVSTLYALDPLSSTLSFTDGKPGHVILNNRRFNRNSDINFGNYLKDGFSVGIEGGRYGTLIDLGTAEEFAKRNGFQETVGNGQGYASLHFEKDQLVTLKDYRTGEFQPLKEAGDLLSVPDPKKKHGESPAIAGHIYLARITDRHDPGFELVVKFVCIAHTPNESATIRWEVLRRTEGTRR
jgi:hypothetical protein